MRKAGNLMFIASAALFILAITVGPEEFGSKLTATDSLLVSIGMMQIANKISEIKPK